MNIAVAVENADASEALVTTLNDLGFVSKVCSSISEVRASNPSVAFCEWPLRSSASQLIEYLQENALSSNAAKVVVLVPGGSLVLFQRARQLGASDVLFSPPDPLEVRAEMEELTRPQQQSNVNRDALSEILRRDLVGESPSFVKCINEMKIAIDSSANVLLTGETGTGKEMFARAIHQLGPRATEPYIAVNCASLPGDLIESELFGHVRGSFTGADRDRQGRFDAVAAGTLLLDEIGDLALPFQTKLLRVIEGREFQRVGENVSRPFRGRLICATSIDLDDAVAHNQFRRDLFGRINQLRIVLPAISDRRSDIPILVKHFLRKHAGGRDIKISSSAMDVLAHSAFPMNVRQVENIVVSAVARSSPGDTILPKHLPVDHSHHDQRSSDCHVVELPRTLKYNEAREYVVQQLDRLYLEQLLAKHGGNQTLAAQDAGIDRKTFSVRLAALKDADLP